MYVGMLLFLLYARVKYIKPSPSSLLDRLDSVLIVTITVSVSGCLCRSGGIR